MIIDSLHGFEVLLFYVRNTGELESTLSQIRPATSRLLEIVRAGLPIDPLERNASKATKVRPVSGEVYILEGFLLRLQLFLRQLAHWHVAGVYSETRLRGILRRIDVVVRGTAIPDDEIAWLHTHFLPFAAFVRKPLEPCFRKAVPLLSPGPDLRLVDELLMELLGKQMSTLTNDQTAVVRPVRKEINQALEAAEPWLRGVLILVWPWLVRFELLAVGKGEVDCVETDDQILGGVYFLESAYDARLLSDCPSPRFMSGA